MRTLARTYVKHVTGLVAQRQPKSHCSSVVSQNINESTYTSTCIITVNVARLILDPAPFRVDTFVHLHVIDPHNSDNEYVTCPKFMYIYDTSLNNEINFEYKFNLFFFFCNCRFAIVIRLCIPQMIL